jgi:hypothetical protein
MGYKGRWSLVSLGLLLPRRSSLKAGVSGVRLDENEMQISVGTIELTVRGSMFPIATPDRHMQVQQ